MKRILILALLAAALAPQAVLAQTVVMAKNQARRLSLPAPVGAVVVANKAVADAYVIDKDVIVMVGKDFGSTSIIVFDRQNKALFDGQVTVSATDVSEVSVVSGVEPSSYSCPLLCRKVEGSSSAAPTPAGSSTAGSQMVGAAQAAAALPNAVAGAMGGK